MQTLKAESSQDRPLLLVQSIEAQQGPPGVREIAVMSVQLCKLIGDRYRG